VDEADEGIDCSRAFSFLMALSFPRVNTVLGCRRTEHSNTTLAFLHASLNLDLPINYDHLTGLRYWSSKWCHLGGSDDVINTLTPGVQMVEKLYIFRSSTGATVQPR
jgi:hypothetical protein